MRFGIQPERYFLPKYKIQLFHVKHFYSYFLKN